MDCQGVQKYMEMWIDEEMDASSRRDFAEHLDACGPCRERVEGETRLERAIRDRVPKATMPSDTWTRITRRLEREARPTRRGALAALAVTVAACAVLAGTWYAMWYRQRPDLETAVLAVHRKVVAGELKPEFSTKSADDVEQFLLQRLGLAINMQNALSGTLGCHDVTFEGVSVVSVGGVSCACLSYRCCGTPVSVVLVPSDGLARFPEIKKAVAELGPRLHDEYRATNIEVRAGGHWLACLVGDHPIEDLAAVFEKI